MGPVAENDEYNRHCNFEFTEYEKAFLVKKFATELPALRGKVGISQEQLAKSVGVSRQTYNAYETMTRPIPWNVYLALLFYFDKNSGTHNMLRQLDLFPISINKDELYENSDHQSNQSPNG